MATSACDSSITSAAIPTDESWGPFTITLSTKTLQNLKTRLSEDGYCYVIIMQKKAELEQKLNSANSKKDSKETTEAEQIKTTLLKQMQSSKEFQIPDGGSLITALNMCSALTAGYAKQKETLLQALVNLQKKLDNVISALKGAEPFVAVSFLPVINHLNSCRRAVHDTHKFINTWAHKTDAEEAQLATTGAMYIPGGPAPLPALILDDDSNPNSESTAAASVTTATVASVATKGQHK